MEHVEKHIKPEELDGLLAEWKRILRLEDWDIKAKICRGNGLNMPEGTQGRCEWTEKRKEAFIKLMDPTDWDSTCMYPQDMEVTLVHELIHLHCAPFDTFKESTPEDTAMEQMIVRLSQALVGLKRRGPNPSPPALP